MNWVDIATGGNPSSGDWETLKEKKAQQQAEKEARQQSEKEARQQSEKEAADQTQYEKDLGLIEEYGEVFLLLTWGQIPLEKVDDRNIWSNKENKENVYTVSWKGHGWELKQVCIDTIMTVHEVPIKLTTNTGGKLCFIDPRK